MKKRHDNSAILESGFRGRVAFLRVAGEINMAESPHLEAALLEAIESRPDGLVVDLSQVCYMDTSGIATLTLALARSRKMGVSFWLVEPSPPGSPDTGDMSPHLRLPHRRHAR